MTHTAELYTEITREEYAKLKDHARLEYSGDGKIEYHVREMEQHGITDIKPHRVITPSGYPLYYCNMIINLQRIVNNGERTIETYNNERDYESLEWNFYYLMSKLLPRHSVLNEWSLQRIDYNIDLKMTPQDVEHYIILLQRGGKNYSWHVHEFADEKRERRESKHGHRKKTHPIGSILFDNKQYSVNIYNKYLERAEVQRKRKITDAAELKASEGVLRIEIQVKRNKLNVIKSKIKGDFDFEGKPIGCFARYDVAIPIIMKALEDIGGRADYTTFQNAQKRVISGVRSEKTQTAIIRFLSLVTQTKSLWRAKELFEGDIKTETILGHLKRLNINPVTIPISFKREKMDNLFDIVAVQFAEECEHGRIQNFSW